jgi:hypothetical protein
VNNLYNRAIEFTHREFLIKRKISFISLGTPFVIKLLLLGLLPNLTIIVVSRLLFTTLIFLRFFIMFTIILISFCESLVSINVLVSVEQIKDFCLDFSFILCINKQLPRFKQQERNREIIHKITK